MRFLLLSGCLLLIAPPLAHAEPKLYAQFSDYPTGTDVAFTDAGGAFSITAVDVNDRRCRFTPWRAAIEHWSNGIQLPGSTELTWRSDEPSPDPVVEGTDLPGVVKSWFTGTKTTYAKVSDGLALKIGDTLKAWLPRSPDCGDRLINMTVELADGTSLDFVGQLGGDQGGDAPDQSGNEDGGGNSGQ